MVEGTGSIAGVEAAPEVTVVVPAYRAAGQLERCVKALCAQTSNATFEIIVVVSGDDTDDLSYADNLVADPRLSVVVRRPRLARRKGAISAFPTVAARPSSSPTPT